jgi:hypothetical protein
MKSPESGNEIIRKRAFVIRVWQGASGRVWGHIVEPLSEYQWLFTNQEELFRVLEELVARKGEAGELANPE